MTNYQARLFAATAVVVAGSICIAVNGRDAGGAVGGIMMFGGVCALIVNPKRD